MKVSVEGILKTTAVSPADPPSTGMPQSYFAVFSVDLPPSNEVTVEVTRTQYEALVGIKERVPLLVEWSGPSMVVWKGARFIVQTNERSDP